MVGEEIGHGTSWMVWFCVTACGLLINCFESAPIGKPLIIGKPLVSLNLYATSVTTCGV
jgi:hypothetical protein